MHRPSSSKEQTQMAAFLCSDRASFVTGTFVPIDGGWSRNYAGLSTIFERNCRGVQTLSVTRVDWFSIREVVAPRYRLPRASSIRIYRAVRFLMTYHRRTLLLLLCRKLRAPRLHVSETSAIICQPHTILARPSLARGIHEQNRHSSHFAL